MLVCCFFALLSLITVFVGVKGITDVISMSAITDKLYKHPFAVSTSTLKIRAEIVSMHRSMKDVALAKNDFEMNKAIALVDEHERNVFREFELIHERFLGDLSRVREAERLFTDWKSIRDEVIAKMQSGDRSGAAYITKNKGADHVKKMSASIDYLINFAFNKAAAFIANATDKKEQTIQWAIISCSIAVLLSLLTAFAIIKSITARLQQTNALLADISDGDGDLAQRLPETGSDELTALSVTFNRFISKIQVIIREVTVETEAVKGATSAMVDVVQELNANMVRQNAEVDSVVTAITEVNSSATEVATSASQTAEAAIASNQNTQTGRETVDQSIRVVNDLASNITDSHSEMENLNQQVNNIVSVLDVIRDIAEQTNLLALNAAIEAARAGEMGRGFAVVADEVRSLAGRTQDSTNEIHGMIENLQNGAQQAMQAMSVSRNHSEDAVRFSRQSGASLDSIAASIGQIESMNIQIASAIEQITKVTEDITENAVSVADLSSQTLDKTRTAENEISWLDTSTQNLHRLVAQFKV